MFDRLIACGFTDRMAWDIIIAYANDLDGLAQYVKTIELMHSARADKATTEREIMPSIQPISITPLMPPLRR